MPQLIVCSGCKFVLYNSEELVVPGEFIRQGQDRCPKCGRKLEPNPSKISITTRGEAGRST